MKKFLVLAVVFTMSCVAIGCSGSPTSAGTTKATTKS